nr:predicted GPI-anchored protein 58 [Aegilops tauschii subsp. strangulata]
MATAAAPRHRPASPQRALDARAADHASPAPESPSSPTAARDRPHVAGRTPPPAPPSAAPRLARRLQLPPPRAALISGELARAPVPSAAPLVPAGQIRSGRTGSGHSRASPAVPEPRQPSFSSSPSSYPGQPRNPCKIRI